MHPLVRLFAGVCAAALAAAETAPAPAPADVRQARAPETWRDSRIRAASWHGGERLATAIFELIEDVPLVDLDIGGDGARVVLNVGRRVYDNHDVLGSYTVADRFRIRTSYPIVSLSEPMAGSLTARFDIGGRVGLDFVHIRQVLPNQYEALAPVESRAADIGRLLESAPLAAEPVAGGAVADAPREPDEWMLVDGSVDSRLFAFDGLTKARYGRLWNLLVVPLRTPFQAEWTDRLRPGDIVSYGATGQIEVGPSIVLNADITGITQMLAMDAGVRIFVSGEFRVSVLREDEHHAQVKVSRTGAFGRSATAGSGVSELIEGWTLLNSDVGARHTSLIPFRWDTSRSRGKSLDLVYRYDLRDPRARSAYERAVLGRLAMSDRLAGGLLWRDAPADAPVQRVGERLTAFDDASRASRARYGIVYRHHHDSSVRHADILLRLRDGDAHVYRSSARNGTRWRWVWGVYEKRSYDFRVNIDLDRLVAVGADAMTLTASGEIADTDTSGPELAAYIAEVEHATGRTGFFPNSPLWLPSEAPPRVPAAAEFERRLEPGYRPAPARAVDHGRSSFFYQVTWSQAQLERFLGMPRERMWPLLEQAFRMRAGRWATPPRRLWYHITHFPATLLNFPLYAVNQQLRSGSVLWEAERVRRLWVKAQDARDPKRRARLLGELFLTRSYSVELLRLLRLALPGERVSYVMQGQSYAFGRLRDEGSAGTDVDPRPERMERVIEFDRVGARPTPANSVALAELRVRAIDDQRVRMTFTLPEVPVRALYVRLVEYRRWRLARVAGEVVITGFGERLRAGHNDLVIDRRGGMLSALLARAQPGGRYELALALSRDGRTWGPIADVDFDLPLPPPPEADPLRPPMLWPE